MRWDIGRRGLDVLGVSAAALYALPTLAYPPARDQALFFYVAREWLVGKLPYRDVFDIKPPAIFVVNALSIVLFGARPWGVRVLELLGLLAMAWLVVRSVARDTPRRYGELGAVALVLVGWYFGALDWVDTGEPEFWEGLVLLGSYVAARTIPSARQAALVSGALLGVAVLFKFPAAVVAVVPLGELAARTRPWKRVLEALALFGGAAAAVVATAAAYFAVRGGFGDMVDALFGYVLDYQRHSPAPPDELARTITFDFWVRRGWPWIVPVGLSWFLAVAFAASRRSGEVFRGAFAALALFALAFGSVVLQRRFNAYYWGVTTPFVGCLAAYGIAEGARFARGRVLVGAAAVVVLGFLYSPPWIHNPGDYSYRTHLVRTVAYARGQIDRAKYLESFVGFARYDYAASERVGQLLRARARPGDTLVVRGYEPAVYVVSGLSSPSRFASDIALWQAGVTYKRAEWTAEYARTVWSARPRFIVGLAPDVVDCESIAAHGYREIARDGDFVVFERVLSS